jgi:hypothetical protein
MKINQTMEVNMYLVESTVPGAITKTFFVKWARIKRSDGRVKTLPLMTSNVDQAKIFSTRRDADIAASMIRLLPGERIEVVRYTGKPAASVAA